jgi:hypothetical protein
MARIAGIRTEKDSKGNISKVTFDMKKHGSHVRPILAKLGAIEEEEDFEKLWNDPSNLTVEEFRAKMYEIIEERWKTR